MIIINDKSIKFAFNWNPKVKHEKLIQYYRGDDFAVFDFWKFRLLLTELTLRRKTNE